MLNEKILIIDDESDYCLIMQSYFRKRGYTVFLASTLKDGLDLLQTEQPDILFLDNNLPDGKGWQHIESIMSAHPKMRLFLVSAFRQESNIQIDSPLVTIWEKPISLANLNAAFATQGVK